ncbi:MBL fold metallo-hydrolase [uncultured Rikenella sp.]|uniref:MBL fold metallo-hydrolase n=1 Tax=uncultured Rikenella sp. TaxID=368003 RepID=UPI002605364A|nr:MBL fold metallo-hydrolase [uncultured Rikenella sp.]
MLKLATLTFNPFGENTYVLFDETKQCVLVDVGCSTEQERQTLAAFIEKNDLRPMMAINTHGHVDHICGVEFAKRQWGIPFALHRNDRPLLEMAHCYADMGFDVDPIPTVDVDLAETETIPVGNSTLRILQTPGHSPGHVAIHVPDAELLLTGDLLFKESIGRTDLPGGSYPTLMESIISQVIPLGGDTRIFPGHGPGSTVAHEVMFNPFIVEALRGDVNYKSDRTTHEN